MAKKKAASADVSHARLKALKSIGLMTDIDSRRTLTDAQKKRIREATRKNHSLLTAEKGDYEVQTVKYEYSTAQKKAMASAGIKLIGNKAYIPKQGYKGATLTAETVWIDGKPKTIPIIRRTYGDRKTADEFLMSPTDKAAWAERINSEYNALELKQGQYFAAKTYDNRPIARSFTTIGDFFAYEAQMHLSDNTDREKLRDNLHLVRITVREMRDLEIGHRDQAEKRTANRKRSKKAKPLHSGRLKKSSKK